MNANRKTNFPRWGLLVTALIAGALLCLTAIESFRSAGELFEVAGTSQAEAFLRQLRREAGKNPATSESLKEFLSDTEDLGLRYIGFYSFEGKPLAEAGEISTTPLEFPADPRERALTRIGSKIRYTASVPPRMTRHMNGMRMRMPPPEVIEEDLPQMHSPNRLVMEFEPVLWRLMRWRLTLTLIAAIGASCLLMASAVVFYRQYKRMEVAEAELREHKRLAALGEMSAVLAHEIKNPLASLKGQAQLLEESLTGKEAERAGAVVREAVRLHLLVNELLDFARSNKLNIEDANPLEVLSDAATAAEPGRIAISVAGAPHLWPLDRARVAQALTNLIRNALQASPEGEAVEASVTASEGHLRYTISDRGEGVPPADRDQIFEPFHTGRVRGVGLGLAVVKKVAEAHGGTITVADRSGGGAVFTLSLPGKGGKS